LKNHLAKFAAALALVLVACGSAALGDTPGRVTVTILQTTDLHGHLMPWNYQREREEDVGLARLATRIAAIRKSTPNVVVLDAGDTIQGTPVEYLHAKSPAEGADPTVLAMNAIGYDAMAVGNHEFNFGLEVLRKAEKEAAFPWLSANTLRLDGTPAFREYVVKEVGGVRVGILGLTTPGIPVWEPEANRPGLKWEEPVVTANRLVPVLRGKERCDLVVVLVHSGPERDLVTLQPNNTDHENRVVALAQQVPGIDLLLTGHTHRKIPLTRLNGVPLIQPGRWGEVLARVDVVMT
jgi:2',3'-cyclic-nucleotide 2'-phosphodiesterase/3'-nucleotidase